MTYIEEDVPVLFTPDQTAKILNVSKSQVFALIRTGELGSMQIGRSRRVSQNQICAFISEREQRKLTQKPTDLISVQFL
jgi:excisionase family DNA binding protein